jgi:hypothetical protein
MQSSFLLITVVLVFRTWAIWGKNNRIAIALLALIFTMMIPIGVFTHLSAASLKCTFTFMLALAHNLMS